MKKPMYYINLAGVNLHNVENIHDENGRDISTYDGVGSGKFNQPDSKTPHSWKFDCELWQDGNQLNGMNTWSASELFKMFDQLLENTKDPSRFVLTSEFYPVVNMSTLVWFKRYTRDESYPGVYKTTIEVEEYKPVGVKTTDIPYVARPGKLPTPPKTITVKSSKTLSDATKKYTGKPAIVPTTGNTASFGAFKQLDYANSKTGKPVSNPTAVQTGTTLSIVQGVQVDPASVKRAQASQTSYAGTGSNVWDGPVESVKSTFQWMAKGIENFIKNPGF